jgi:hypothetical protein
MKHTERAVLEEVVRAGLPVQILVNKADRLTPDDISRVLDVVRVGLADAGVRSWAPPLALSAKRALEGRLGDRTALERSGWHAVERLLEEQIVGRSRELKERALRRRAVRLIAPLVADYRTRLARDDEAALQTSARARTAAHEAARIEQEAEPIATQLEASLRSYALAWARDLEQVFVGRDARRAMADPALSRYRVERAIAALAGPLTRALTSAVPAADVPPDALDPPVRAIVRTAAACAPPDADALIAGIARAAVATLVELLLRFEDTRPASTHAAGTLRELEALALALQ